MPDSLPPLDHDRLLHALSAVLPGIGAGAAARDADASFPATELAALASASLFVAPLPRAAGGLGWGTEPVGAAPLARALRRIGRASLPVGRLYEGHVNALRLVFRHGTPAARSAAVRDARAGLLFGVWNTPDPHGPPLTLDATGRLAGRKVLCSGAGFVARAVVTANEAAAAPVGFPANDSGAAVSGAAMPTRIAASPQAGTPPRMVLVPLAPTDAWRADLAPWTAQGMRASATGHLDFTGLLLDADSRLGVPGAYTQEPDLSAGAWRFCAVQLGGVEAMAGALREHLNSRGRGGDAHQAARFGRIAVATETARLWVTDAAKRAEAGTPDAVAYVQLARQAVERAALSVIELAQRSAGLSGFLRPEPLERIARDLATYLRQPAPDRALTAAAAHVLAAAAEVGDLWDDPWGLPMVSPIDEGGARVGVPGTRGAAGQPGEARLDVEAGTASLADLPG